MGLKHQAIHAMLANPTVAPFEVISEPRDLRDWILIDHLMVIYKVKSDDYVEGDHGASVLNMVKTLAGHYAKEAEGGRSVVLVKDGPGVQKPSVRELRSARVIAPHIQFCRNNLRQIEYGAMKILADMGMKENFFLVTGSEWGDTTVSSGDSSPDGNEALVSFHQEYMEHNKPKEERSPIEAFSEVDPSYCEGEIVRPRGVSGVFAATFAYSEGEDVIALREACKKCKNSEADTLLVELANVLEGEITVCTGDSDLVAVLTASGREGLILRLDNLSYRQDRAMHDSPFGELLTEPSIEKAEGFRIGDSDSQKERFRILCDLDEGEHCMLTDALRKHEVFERVLQDNEGVSIIHEVFQYLCRGGIRGSVYVAFLDRFLESGAREDKVMELVRKVRESKRHPDSNAVRFLFETFSITPAKDSDGCVRIAVGEKRKHAGDRGDDDDDTEPNECNAEYREEGELCEMTLAESKTLVTSGLKRAAKAYMKGRVPQGSHSRFLKLNRSGRYLFLRVKPKVLLDKRVRMELLMFMALCGTDYSVTLTGLGIKRLLTGAVSKQQLFSLWCSKLADLLWTPADEKRGEEDRRSARFHKIGMELARLSEIQQKIRSTHWTESKCELMFKTLKYVCDLWSLKRPQMSSEYGFSIHDGTVRFLGGSGCDEGFSSETQLTVTVPNLS